MRNFSKKHQLTVALLSATTLLVSACNNTGSAGNNNSGGNGDATTLQIITPKTIYSTTAANNGYVTIQNNTESPVKNIHYATYGGVGSGSTVQVDDASALSCSTMPAHSQCNIKVTVPAASVAGSFSIKATNDSSLLQRLAQSANATPITSLPIGVEQAAYNTVPGADGITLSYYNTVINGVLYVLVSGVVASSKAGNFNNIVLVDNNGNALPNQQLISGAISSTQGSTFTILIPVPAASSASQTIKAQTRQIASDGKVTVVSTAQSSSTLSTTTGVGIANILPNAVYLTESNPEQAITISNNGDALATLQSLISSNSNIEISFSSSSLASGTSTTATLKLKNPKAVGTSGSIILSYNNGQQETTISAETQQNVNPQPSPSPTPTPTPTPGPTPTPQTAGLTAAFSPNNNFFKTTLGTAVTRQLTLTNTGNTIEDGIVLTLPTYFSISSGASNSCTVTSGTSPATISDSLPASTGSCDVTVVYANPNETSEDSDNISIAYNYNNGTAAPPATAAVNYRVTPSTAILSLTNPWSPYNFINILPNGFDLATQTFTLYNSGEVNATNVSGSVSPGLPFSILSNYTATIAAGTSSSLNLQFGSSSTPTVNFSDTLTVNYDDYSTHTAAPITVNITGSVSNTIAYLYTIAATGFAGGDGQTAATAYALQTGSNGQVTLTYQNKGSIAAQSFNFANGTTISSKLAGTPFTLLTDGCNLDAGGKTLAPNETCNEVLQYSPTTVGATTLPLDTSNWMFSYSGTQGSYTYNSAPVYFSAYAPATIAITNSGLTNGNISAGGNFQIRASLSGGYQIANQTIALQNLNPADANINTSNTCQVSSTANQCSITVPTGSSTAIGSYTLDVVNQTGGVTVTSGSSIAFSVTPAVPLLTPLNIVNNTTMTYTAATTKTISSIITNNSNISVTPNGNFCTGQLIAANTTCNFALSATNLPNPVSALVTINYSDGTSSQFNITASSSNIANFEINGARYLLVRYLWGTNDFDLATGFASLTPVYASFPTSVTPTSSSYVGYNFSNVISYNSAQLIRWAGDNMSGGEEDALFDLWPIPAGSNAFEIGVWGKLYAAPQTLTVVFETYPDGTSFSQGSNYNFIPSNNYISTGSSSVLITTSVKQSLSSQVGMKCTYAAPVISGQANSANCSFTGK